MSFNWTEYLTLAQELTGQSTSSSIQEACLRAAISRAYYAAFCNARNFLKNKDGYLSPNTGSVHKDIIERFEFSNDATRRYVGSLYFWKVRYFGSFSLPLFLKPENAAILSL